MTVLLYIVDALFALLALGIFASFTQSKHIGLLLGALCFGSAAALSFYLQSWWPLPVGFAAAWGVRLLGGDPGYN